MDITFSASDQREATVVSHYLGESKVGDYRCAVVLHEDVRRFEVKVHLSLRVHVYEGSQDLI